VGTLYESCHELGITTIAQDMSLYNIRGVSFQPLAMRGSCGAKLNKSEDAVQKTVPLAPTVRRSIASPVRVPGLEYITKDSGPTECEHCYGLGLIPIGNLDHWSGCLWCKTSNLHVFICRVGTLFLAVRDVNNSIGWGENVIDALLQCETTINESDSVWSNKYAAKTDQKDPISVTIQRRTYAILEKQALLQGYGLDEMLAKFATGNIEGFVNNGHSAISEEKNRDENLNTLKKEHTSDDSTSRVNTG